MLPGRLPGEVFVVCPSERRPLGQNQDSLERLHLTAGVETILCHLDELQEAEVMQVWDSLLRLMPLQLGPR